MYTKKTLIILCLVVVFLYGCTPHLDEQKGPSYKTVTVHDLLVNSGYEQYNGTFVNLHAKLRFSAGCIGPSMGCKINCNAKCTYYPIIYSDEELPKDMYGDHFLDVKYRGEEVPRLNNTDGGVINIPCNIILKENVTYNLLGKPMLNSFYAPNGVTQYWNGYFDIYDCKELT